VHFEPQAVPAEMASLFRQFVSITTWKPWAKRLADFDRRIAQNPLLDEYFAQRYPIEVAMRHLHQQQLRGARFRLPTDHAETALFGFIAMVARVHPRLGPRGQTRLAGMLRSGLDTEAGLAPLEHEMGIAAHLMARGFDVSFSDIETGGGFDILARRDVAVLEVECKTVSGDLGRKIHQRRLYQLGGQVYQLMGAALERRAVGQLARIQLPDRLRGTDQQLKAIRERLAKVLESGQSISEPSPCAIDYREFSLAGSPFETMRPETLDMEAARQYVERAVGLPLEHAVMVFRPFHSAVVIAIESLQDNSMMRGLVRQLKDSVKSQLTGTFAAAVCVKFTEVTQEQLLEIAEQDKSGQPSALRVASSYLLNREDWRLVHTLAYFTPGRLTASRTVHGQTVTQSVQEQGRPYVFKNPHNAVAGDPRYSIF